MKYHEDKKRFTEIVIEETKEFFGSLTKEGAIAIVDEMMKSDAFKEMISECKSEEERIQKSAISAVLMYYKSQYFIHNS